MVNVIKPIHVFSYDDVIESFDAAISDMIDIGVVVFRGTPITPEQQALLMIKFGDALGWYPNSLYSNIYQYAENHKYTLGMRPESCNDDILVEWHMEQIGYPNPAIGASWNMKTFTCDIESGKTYFVDAIKVYQELGTDELSFLSRCRFIEEVAKHRPEYEAGELPTEAEQICPVITHFISGKQMIYVPPVATKQFENKLISVDGRHPNEENRTKFSEICLKIGKIVTENEDIRLVHKWRQNDIVFADLLRHYHAVTGGFSSEQRYFEGVWAFRYRGDKYLSGM